MFKIMLVLHLLDDSAPRNVELSFSFLRNRRNIQERVPKGAAFDVTPFNLCSVFPRIFFKFLGIHCLSVVSVGVHGLFMVARRCFSYGSLFLTMINFCSPRSFCIPLEQLRIFGTDPIPSQLSIPLLLGDVTSVMQYLLHAGSEGPESFLTDVLTDIDLETTGSFLSTHHPCHTAMVALHLPGVLMVSRKQPNSSVLKALVFQEPCP